MSENTNQKVAAKGRGGIINVRNGHFADGKGFAVDAKLPNSKREAARKGLIFRFFADRDQAKAFAEVINAGDHPRHGKEATSAVVVPAYNAENAPFLADAPVKEAVAS